MTKYFFTKMYMKKSYLKTTLSLLSRDPEVLETSRPFFLMQEGRLTYTKHQSQFSRTSRTRDNQEKILETMRKNLEVKRIIDSFYGEWR